MAKQKPKELNVLEQKLKDDLVKLMEVKEVEFSAFLKELRNDLPLDIQSKKFEDYKNKYKAEYLKLLRSSFSFDEVRKILAVIGYEITFAANRNKITPVKNLLESGIKVRYTEVMAVCELLGIGIEWTNKSKK